MRPPFTIEQFFDVFASYNEAVWPGQPLLLLLGICALFLAQTRSTRGSVVVAWILAFLWAWMGIAYHFMQFTGINSAAWLFGVLFLAQAGLFASCALSRGRLLFKRPGPGDTAVGLALAVYALAIYPIFNQLTGHAYMASPTFGAPCPTTILTVGLLFLARRPFPRYLLAVPLFWSVVGGSAAFTLGVLQDLGLVVAGLAGVWLLFRLRPRTMARTELV